MASELTPDGHVIPPRNITKPAPIFDLRGFQWRGRETPGQPAQEPEQHPTDDEPSDTHVLQSVQSITLATQAAPAAQKPMATAALATEPGPSALPKRLPDLNQLGNQLGLETNEPRLPPPLNHFHGAYAGNGFNMIFVPFAFGKPEQFNANAEGGPNDNRLFVQLTTEQWTFGPTLGKIPNRGFGEQPDIDLEGFPYLQTVQDVTNPLTGKGDKPETSKSGIHFEPGMFLYVPGAISTGGRKTISRMASIPHGTTINAQGFVPEPKPEDPPEPSFHELDTTPFNIGKFTPKVNFVSMDAEFENIRRVPENLDAFNNKGTGRITTEIIKNPNLVLKKAIEGLDIVKTVVLELHTGHVTGQPIANQKAKINGGGVTNISFLNGPQKPPTDPGMHTTGAPGSNDRPNAHGDGVVNTWWIETVMYDVVVPPLAPFETATGLWATMPQVKVPGDDTKMQPSLAPTPRFAITAPAAGVAVPTPIKVPGIQLQYSQTVNLNFGPFPAAMLTWPHVSVATLVPVAPQPFQMT